MFRILVLILTVVLSGCATNSLTPKPITVNDLNDAKGLFIGSFSRDPKAPKYYSQTFYLKNIETNEVHEIKSQPSFNMFTGKTPDDFNTQESSGALFVQALPAGKYTYHNFRLYQSNGYYEKNWYSEQDYSIPFEVSANQINYAGEIKLVPVMGKNIFNMNIQAGGAWLISDKLERDLPIFTTKYPQISTENFVKVIPESKEIFTPLVILPAEQDQHNQLLNRTP